MPSTSNCNVKYMYMWQRLSYIYQRASCEVPVHHRYGMSINIWSCFFDKNHMIKNIGNGYPHTHFLLSAHPSYRYPYSNIGDWLTGE